MTAREVSNVFVLTGAGISAESGVRTYRTDTGLWEEHSIEDIATPEGFARDPRKVQAFYDARYRDISASVPNAAHIALARLAEDPRFSVTIVTQNVDDLHERAGSNGVLHIHGLVNHALCGECGEPLKCAGDLLGAGPCPECGHTLARPDITWFGEQPQRMGDIEEAFVAADTFLSIGTSGEVWPAAGYSRRARNRKLRCVEFNLRPTEVSHYFREERRGPASETVPAFVNALLGPDSSPRPGM